MSQHEDIATSDAYDVIKPEEDNNMQILLHASQIALAKPTIQTSKNSRQKNTTRHAIDRSKIEHVFNKKQIRYLGYLYQEHQTPSDGVSYRCIRYTQVIGYHENNTPIHCRCSATIKLLNDNKTALHSAGEHNHGVEEKDNTLAEARYTKLVEYLQLNSTERNSVKICNALNKELSGINRFDPKQVILREHIKKAKKQVLYTPQIENPFDLITRKDLSQTLRNQPFAKGVYCEQGLQMYLFMAPIGMLHLDSISEEDQLYVDGTFRVIPKNMSQIITIMLRKGRSQAAFPCAYVWMQEKNTVNYEFMWRHICEHAPHLKHSGKIFVSVDFEKAMHNAIQAVLPRAEIVGCHFHLIQAIYR
jgi:hypothetical protein